MLTVQIITRRFNDPLQSGGQKPNWTTSGPSGYMTPAVWKVPNISEQGTKSVVGQKSAQWLHACIFSFR